MTDELDRSKLPIPDPSFRGKAGRTLDDSRPDWDLIGHVVPPEGAPNVLLVLIDDAGYGNASAWGGSVNTPNYTRVAEQGLRYNRVHCTALCSPSRAAMLTGRNHHSVGFGSIGELSSGFPGYSAIVPKDCAPFPKILQENGYSTAAFGKWHLTPDKQQGPAGPLDRWPNGWGFDLFYGFLGGESGQWDPCLSENQTTIGVPPAENADGSKYYFPDDMAEKTIEWLHGVRAQDQDKPFFVYFSTGCAHAPHHVPEEWAAKYKGKFAHGWDQEREIVFKRQQELGVVPKDAVLTERNEAFPAWDSLPDEQKNLYERQMEVFAGYSENADWNVGRVLDALEEMGELDNTLVIWIWGDNGSSLEGTLTGSFNELTMQNGIPLSAEQQLALVDQYGGLDVWGTDLVAPHFSAAWAWAGNCPFQWGKQVASHLGGTRQPMAVHWPAKVTGRGHRDQFLHFIDIGPTIMDLAGIPMPTHVNGIAQQPMHGATFAGTIDDQQAPEVRTQQYFEIFGNRAMYKDGWWLSMKMPRVPWDLTPDTMKQYAPGVWDPDSDPAELYYLPDDFAQAHDVAADHPDKVEELKKLFWEEAEKYQVTPLLGGLSTYFGVLPPLPTQTKFKFWGDVQNVASGMIPRIYNHSYSINADLVVPEGGGDGVIVAEADHLGGFSLWVDKGTLKHTYSMMGVFTYKQESKTKLPVGDVTVRMEFAADAAKPATGGTCTLYVNDEAVGDGRMDFSVPVRFSGYSGMDIGRDNGGVVDRDYADRAPFAFNGHIKQVVFDIAPHAAEDEHALQAVAHHGHIAHGMSA